MENSSSTISLPCEHFPNHSLSETCYCDDEIKVIHVVDELICQQELNSQNVAELICKFLEILLEFPDVAENMNVRMELCIKLLSLPLFARSNLKSATSVLIDLAIQSDLPLTARSLVYELLLACGMYHKMVFIWADHRDLFSSLIRRLEDAPGTRLQQLTIGLLFHVCSSSTTTMRRDRVQKINARVLNYLLDVLDSWKGSGKDYNDFEVGFYRDCARILAFFNAQFVTHELENRVVLTLYKRKGNIRIITEYLVYYYNREANPQLLTWMHTLFRSIFTFPPTSRIFYLNDLHVICDVTLRLLRNTEDERVRISGSWMLIELMWHSQWKETSYRWKVIHNLLEKQYVEASKCTKFKTAEYLAICEWSKNQCERIAIEHSLLDV